MRSTMRVLSRLLLIGVVLCAAAPPAWAQDQVRYYHTDAIGSVRMVTDENGQVIARYDFTPFGQDWPTLAAPVDPRGFGGKERDQETGLDYFGGRYYQGLTGRFTTVDPVSSWGNNLVDPQRWNRYSYARNGPLRYVDPDGRAFDTILDVGFVLYDLFDIARSASQGERVSGTQVAALAADVVAAAIPFVTGGGAAVRVAAHAGDSVEAGLAAEKVSAEVGRYVRPSGATTRAQRESVQGKPCVDCGAVAARQVADHKKPLVKEHYETGSIDKKRMRETSAVQPQCPTCSARQGAELSRYSRQQRKKLRDEPQ